MHKRPGISGEGMGFRVGTRVFPLVLGAGTIRDIWIGERA